MEKKIQKGFIQDGLGNTLLPITRAELVLDVNGYNAFHSAEFAAQLPNTEHPDGLPGLMTAAEKALLHTLDSEGSAEGTIANIYTDLATLFGIGIKVDNVDLSYFNDNKVATPISFISGTGISLGVDANLVTVGLDTLDASIEVSGIVSGMSVDEYGRVTGVSTSSALSDVILENATVLTDFKGDTFITDPQESGYVEKANAVAYKRYVDERFEEALGVATGSLKFIGVFDPGTKSVEDYLTNKLPDWNVGSYMLVGVQCSIPSQYITGVENESPSPVNIGDTLIVKEDSKYDKLLVIIPSGDETFVATEISVVGYGEDGKPIDAIKNKTGSVTFSFDSVFNITGTDNEVVDVDINKLVLPETELEKEAFKKSYGIISGEDYIRFSKAAEQSVQYNSEVTSLSNTYKIGEIQFGTSNATDIYGHYNTYTLGTSQVTSTDPNKPENKVNVTLASDIDSIEGSTISVEGDGITVTATDNGLKLSKKLSVDDNSAEYLGIENDVFTINTGNYTETKNEDGTSSYEYTGLATYEQAVRLAQAALSEAEGLFVKFEYIKNPLSQTTGTDADGKPIKYSYGAQLAAAVNIEI